MFGDVGGPRTASISPLQSRCSVDPPCCLIVPRWAARRSARAATSPVSSAPASSRSRWASAGLAPSVLDGDAHRSVAGDGGQDERAVLGTVGGVDPDSGGRCCRGDLVVGVGSGCGDDEAHAVEVARPERSAGQRVDVAGVDRRRHRRRDVRGDDAHDCPSLGESGDLARRHRTGSDDEGDDAVEIESYRVGEPCGHGHDGIRRYPTEIGDS